MKLNFQISNILHLPGITRVSNVNIFSRFLPHLSETITNYIVDSKTVNFKVSK